jgi:anti-sigma regulatory factor (Ser/Thr protein kinase)
MPVGPRRSAELPLRGLVDARVAGALTVRLARESRFSEIVATEIAIVASELATNAVRHAGGGTLRIEACGGRVELVCADRGDGDADELRSRIARAAEGAAAPPRPGGLGHGLGAVVRFSDRVEIAAREGGGIVARAERNAGGARR